jgi:hypothetical protein
LGELNEARYDEQASVYAWLHRQVFVGSQNSLRDGDTMTSPTHSASRDTDQDRWDRDTAFLTLEEADYELELEHSMIGTLLDASRASFDKGNYQDAKLRLQIATARFAIYPQTSAAAMTSLSSNTSSASPRSIQLNGKQPRVSFLTSFGSRLTATSNGFESPMCHDCSPKRTSISESWRKRSPRVPTFCVYVTVS